MKIEQYQAAVAADPVRAWIVAQVGVVEDAEYVLTQYDAQFRTAWLWQELGHEVEALGRRAGDVLDLTGDGLAGLATPAPRRAM